MKRKVLMILGFIVLLATLVACSGGGDGKKEANLEAAYTSPAKMSYTNMRPTYNYYLTTFSHLSLEIYDDGTYVLTLSSSQFSAVVLPEEGNDFSGNERENYFLKFYGEFTSEVDELDETIINYTLKVPTRVVYIFDSTNFYDTANWTDQMATNAGSEEESMTSADYLASRVFEEMVMPASKDNFSIEYVNLVRGPF